MRKSLKKGFAAVFMITLGITLIFLFFRDGFDRNLDDICYIKARGIVSRIINQAVHDKLSEKDLENELFIVRNHGNGVKTVQPNTRLLNTMISDFSLTIQDSYEKMESQKLKIPMGAFTNNKLLSMSDMTVRIRILPLTVSKCDYESSFEEQGINQTKYKVYLKITSTVKVLKPFSNRDVTIENKVLLGEIVILGDVPKNYVNVPEEDILDATI